jgi:putative glutamine amidotransferase
LRKAEQALVNSHHHQAIETIGRDLLATAWSADGLVEALEDSRLDRFALAVQWHPELGWKQDSFSQALFERFIAEARAFARKGREELADVTQPVKLRTTRAS